MKDIQRDIRKFLKSFKDIAMIENSLEFNDLILVRLGDFSCQT